MRLPHYDIKLAYPFVAMGAELPVLDPIKVCLLVLISWKLQSNGFLGFWLSVSLFSFRHMPGLRLVCVARTEQMFHIIPTHGIRYRPAEPNAVRSPDHVTGSVVGNLRAFGNLVTA
jgi:hypothetical protein